MYIEIEMLVDMKSSTIKMMPYILKKSNKNLTGNNNHLNIKQLY